MWYCSVQIEKKTGCEEGMNDTMSAWRVVRILINSFLDQLTRTKDLPVLSIILSERSDTEEQAVDGRVPSYTGDSELADSFFDEGFFRPGTPSGHLHCALDN